MKMKRIIAILFIVACLMAFTGCESVTLNLLSNNNVLSNRSQAAALGDNDNASEGGGKVDLDADVSGTK